MAPSRPDLVLLDAFGTLVAMDPPGPILREALAQAGYHVDDQVVQAALEAEIAHYRARMHIGGDRAGLRELRRECAEVLVRGLGPGAPPVDVATDVLVASLRFRLYDDAPAAMDALDAAGVPMGVVSNWDCALADHLANLGVADRFVVVAVSATVGVAKPGAEIFLHATTRAGVDPARALHVGDRPVEDYQGARAAGLSALLLDRSGTQAGPDVITTLAAIPAIIAE